MLTVTPAASAALATVLAHPDVPEGSGLRLGRGDDTPEGIAIEMAVVERPQPQDEVIETGSGADIFVDPDAVELLGDQVLDAEFDADEVSFDLRPQSLNGDRPH